MADRPLALLAPLAGAVLLASCGTPPAAPSQPPAMRPAVGTPQPNTSSPTPTPKPEELMPGTDHNRAAAAYSYPAQDVHNWLVQGPKAGNYPTDKKIVFLTFDDGPNNSVTPKDLDVLKQNDAHATFFYVAKQLPNVGPAMPQRTIAEGHAVGVHSFSHNYDYLYPRRVANADHITSDYDKALSGIRGVLGSGYTPGAFRYPGGHMSWKGLDTADQELAAKGAYWIDWNSMTGDAEPPKTHPSTPDGMVKMVASESNSAHSNVIVVLMHDAEDKSMTTKALPQVIKYFRDNGYAFGVIG